MSASEFARRMSERDGTPDQHYVFWIGAGCSVACGIPAARELVRDHWLPRLHRLRAPERDIEVWARETFSAYDRESPGALYGPLMEELFPNPDERQRETERLCERRDPDFGYAVLAVLMSRPDGMFSAALTTNFDDLIADAMYVFATQRPLVVQHELLAGFARPGRAQRPLVVKLHGDHRLNPMHTTVETEKLKASMADGMQGLLQDRGVIFVGYSGNDRGVVDALNELPPTAIPQGVWWVSGREPQGAIRPWLQDRKAIWVRAERFEELMLLCREEFQIEHPSAKRFEVMVTGYRDTYEQLSSRVEELPDSTPDAGPLKQAAQRASNEADGWWGVFLAANQLKDRDPKQAEEIYEDGIKTFDESRLLVIYAIFLATVRDEQGRAEELFDRALAVEPNNVDALSGYAWFLSARRGEYDSAEELYDHALAADPNNANTLSGYAWFLSARRGEYDRAADLFERALAVEPNNVDALASYAWLLSARRGEDERAADLFERALAVDPNNTITLSNYAGFLFTRRSEYDGAADLYERALAIDPNNANTLTNYAGFLFARGEDEKACDLVERAFDCVGVGEDLLRAALWFDLLAVGPVERREEALAELARLVAAGVRSRGWDFNALLRRAREDGRADVEWLEKLADVIAEGAQPGVLEGWPAWPAG
jgi:Tfp pilus assembly protein PilF